MAETVTVGWGQPVIEVKKTGETAWTKFATPVEDTTKLECTQGDKMEAKIEGGENEAVKYKANSYVLSFNMRQVPERTDPISEENGIVKDEYSVRVIPENDEAIGILIDRASVNVQTSFDSQNGLIKTYTFDALKPATGNTVKFQAITVS